MSQREEADMSDEPSRLRLANPDTVLGMLQRGRGAGYLHAAEMAPQRVWPMLVECITNDPRLDKQVEYFRSGYYCDLIIETEMDITPLADHLKQNDGPDDKYWDIKLSLETLYCLSASHYGKAQAMLQDYVSYGSHWEDVVRYLWDFRDEGGLDGVDLTVCDRLTNDPVFRRDFESGISNHLKWYAGCEHGFGMLLPMFEPWKTLCRRNAQLAKAFDQLCPPEAIESFMRKEGKPPIDLTGLSVAELFAMTEKPIFYKAAEALEQKLSEKDEQLLLDNLSQDDDYNAKLALKGLSLLGTSAAFEAVKAFIESGEKPRSSVRSHAVKAIGRMPASLSLESARQWFQRKEWHLHVAGGEILSNHATPDDVPLLVDALRTPETIQCEDWRLGNALEAFWRLDGIGHIPEIENVFLAVQHSYYRRDAAWAMDSTAPDVFQANYAYECLWDCHDDTRICGCETVSLSQPGALARLKEIAEDPYESERVRDSAVQTLDEF